MNYSILIFHKGNYKQTCCESLTVLWKFDWVVKHGLNVTSGWSGRVQKLMETMV